MPKGYAYIRYSTSAQGAGDSVQRQLAPLTTFTATTGIEIAETLMDEGVSSFRGDNASKGKLKEILDRIDRGQIKKGDYLVVESIDRITRQRLIDGVELLQSILKKGVRIYTTTDKRTYSYDDPKKDFETLLMISLIATRANEESETKSDRRRSAWSEAKAKAANGGSKFNHKNPPYGLSYNNELGEFEINESEADEIRQIFELLKLMGVSNAVKTVNAESGRKWTNRHVMMLFETKYPLGVLRSQRRNEKKEKVFIEYIDDYYPKMVSQTLFNDALAAMEGRRKRNNYGKTSLGWVNIFRHVVKCGECGKTLLFDKQRNPKGVVYPYLHCFTRKELHGKCSQRFRFDLAFGMLLQMMKDMSSGWKSSSLNGELGKSTAVSVSTFTNQFFVEKPKFDPAYKAYLSPSFDAMKAELEQYESLEKDLNSFLSIQSSSDVDMNNEFDKESEKLAALSGRYERTTSSLEGYDGNIPLAVIKNLGEQEANIKAQTAIVEKLGRATGSNVPNLKIKDYKDVIELFSSESGRLALNNFFVIADVKFVFTYTPVSRLIKMQVLKSDKSVVTFERRFPFHNPLLEFGIEKLETLYGDDF